MKMKSFYILLLPSFLSAFLLPTAIASPSNPYALYGDWPANNNGADNLGATTKDNAINPTNALSLQKVFQMDSPNGAGVDSTPTLADGLVYVADGNGVVSEIDGKTGAVIWQTQLVGDGTQTETFSNSPVLTKDKLFIAQDYMFALDRHTGKVLWKSKVFPTIHNISSILPSQLMVAGNKVVMGFGFQDEDGGPFAPADYQYETGQIVAFNQDTGNVDWRLDINQNGGGGAGSFAGGGVDSIRHLLFFGTSNNYALPASPISDSLVAVNYDTGQLVWHYQYKLDDVWNDTIVPDGTHDMDVKGHPMLFTINIPGHGTMDLVSEVSKDGTIRIFNRDQANPNSVQPIAQVQFAPGNGFAGSINLSPALNNGIMYVAASAISSNGTRLSLDFAGDSALFAGDTHVIAVDLAKLINETYQSPTPICYNGDGTMIPNVCTGSLSSAPILWDLDLGNVGPLNSSGLTYDNGVIFAPMVAGPLFTNIGNLFMIDANKGSLIGTLNTPAAISPIFGILPNNWLCGGVSIRNGMIYFPFGFTYGGGTFGNGGIVGYGIKSN